ncbi:transposase [Mesorhizobium sp. L2C067A000]|nr:transposase [Mesorhizobium sp. L2C067A000]
MHVMLTREGWDINMKRTYRIYSDLGLQLRNKTPKRRVKAKLRDDRQPAVEPNDVWAFERIIGRMEPEKEADSKPLGSRRLYR